MPARCSPKTDDRVYFGNTWAVRSAAGVCFAIVLAAIGLGYLLDREQLVRDLSPWLYPTLSRGSSTGCTPATREGVPQQDYYPLLAFLARSLTPEEVSQVLATVEAEHGQNHQTSAEDVRTAIEAVTRSPALGTDVQRIEKRLRDLGWNLEPAADR